MKKLHYMMLLALLLLGGAGQLTAQTADGLWLTSRQRVSGSHGGLSAGTATWGVGAPPSVVGSPVVPFRGTGSVMTSGSRYRAQVSAVGASSVAIPYNPARPRREGENPFGDETIDDTQNPNEPGTPLGDIPFLLLLTAAAAYAFRLHRRLGRPSHDSAEGCR